MMRVRQLQGDVNEREEAELRRLEGGLQVGGDDAVDEAVLAAPPVRAQDGTVVSGAARRSEQISSKLFKNGGCRDSSKIVPILPRGRAGLKSKVPKRKDFGVVKSDTNRAKTSDLTHYLGLDLTTHGHAPHHYLYGFIIHFCASRISRTRGY